MSRPLRLDHIDLSFHAASAAAVQLALQRYEHEVEVSTAPHQDRFRRLGRRKLTSGFGLAASEPRRLLLRRSR